MYKNNSRDSSIFKGYSPLQLYRKLKVLSSAIGYYSYTNRYPALEETKPNGKNEKNIIKKEFAENPFKSRCKFNYY